MTAMRKPTGAEVVLDAGTSSLVRILWREGSVSGESFRIVRPSSALERALFSRERVTPARLKRVSVSSYLLIPVFVFLNTVVPRFSAVPYEVVLGLTVVVVALAVFLGLWFFFGARMVDRLEVDPLHAMKAPAVAVPDWWASRLDEVSPEAVAAYQAALLEVAVLEERRVAGEVLLGGLPPRTVSSEVVGRGLRYVSERRRQLLALLAAESFEVEHLRALVDTAGARVIPDGVAVDAVDAVRAWADG